MRKRLTIVLACLGAAMLAATAVVHAASAIGIYRNNLDRVGKRAQVVKLSGRNCNRGGASRAFRVMVGRSTEECLYRTPVVGRDLEAWTTVRLLSGTPNSIRKRTFVAVNLRAGSGGKYQLAVFPGRRKVQLRKEFPNGARKFLKVRKRVKRVKNKPNRANKLRLRAFNITAGSNKGGCRLVVHINDKRLFAVTDPKGGELDGRYAGFSIGSSRNSRGAVASFDDLVVRVPSPF